MKKFIIGFIILFVFFLLHIGCSPKEKAESKQKISAMQKEELPDYRIISQVKLISGAGKHGDVLITSFSKETPINTKERILRKIAKKEGFVSAGLYCTMGAYKANYSSSYLKDHPNALKKGYLGKLKEDGTFIEK